MYTNPKFRSTPYRKTPSRMCSMTLANTSDERSVSRAAKKQIHDERAAMTKSQWLAFKMTPLYKFSPNRLRTYSRNLSAFVQSTKGESTDEIVDVASIRTVNSLHLTQDNPTAIEIVLKQRSKGEMRVVLTAILCGVGVDPRSCPDAFLHYPVMLHTGMVGASRLLNKWLTSEFDCCASPLTLSPTDLTWLLAILTTPATDDRKTKLEYCVPQSCPGISNISLHVNHEDCQRLWFSIHDRENENIEIREVAMFITCLQQHFYSLFKLDLSCFRLDKIGTSMADVSSDGKVKFHHPDYVVPVLVHITENALLQLRI